PHTRYFFRSAVVDMFDLAAKHRTLRKRRKLHVRHHGVDAKNGLAVGFVRRVETFQRLTDQREVLRILELRLVWKWQLSGGIGELAVSERTVACGVRNLTVRGTAARRINLPLRGRSRDQHDARSGACLAQLVPECTDRAGTAGYLKAEEGVAVEFVARRPVLDYNLCKVCIQFFREDHGDRGVDALSHFGLRHDQCGLAGLVDADEGVWGQ